MDVWSEEAVKFVWEGAIPIQVHLHESEVTTLPPPPPAMALAPRTGYLPLLIPQIKPHFNSALPPGVDTVWFDYKGVPLKWYIPTGVLFDLLCAEPERPWNLTVHFRGYPADSLTPCANEEAVKWSFINAMKEAAYMINGNCKSIMNMSQADQYDLWQSIMNGSFENYCRIVSRLKLGTLMEDCKTRTAYGSQQVSSESINLLPNQTGRIPVRLYIRTVEGIEDIVDSWDRISFLNRPAENRIEDGLFTLRKAVKFLLPELFEPLHASKDDSVEASPPSMLEGADPDQRSRIKILRIQGIKPSWDTPFAWVVNNLAHPDFFIHICIFVSQS